MVQAVEFYPEIAIVRNTGFSFVGLISITEPGRQAPLKEDEWASVLRLEFDDIKHPHPGYRAFSRNQAVEIIKWLRLNEHRFEIVFVHCWAGVSRSAAVAIALAQLYQVNFDLTYDAYNPLVYRIMKEVVEELYDVKLLPVRKVSNRIAKNQHVEW